MAVTWLAAEAVEGCDLISALRTAAVAEVGPFSQISIGFWFLLLWILIAGKEVATFEVSYVTPIRKVPLLLLPLLLHAVVTCFANKSGLKFN